MSDNTLSFIEINYRLCALIIFFHTDCQLFDCIVLSLCELSAAVITDAFDLAGMVLNMIDGAALRADTSSRNAFFQNLKIYFKCDNRLDRFADLVSDFRQSGS